MNIDWSKAPEGATHYAEVASGRVCWYMVKSESEYAYAYAYTYQDEDFSCGRWANGGRVPRHQPLIERPKKQESWDGECLPPVGLDVLAKVDFKKAPPYTIINLTEIGIDVQNSIPSFQKAKVLYASEKYVILLARGVECMAPRSCVEFEKIKTADQLAEEEKVTAIAEMQSVVMAASGCTVSTISECLAIVALYEAGYRKQ